MDSSVLSLKWNNHVSAFCHLLKSLKKKELYSDVTIACEGKFFSAHKFVLSTCSEYFQQMFERTQCKHPIIVLKDVPYREMEALLNYMYIGEVNVQQSELSSLIKAAESLRILGLAVPDEPHSTSSSKSSRDSNKRGHGHDRDHGSHKRSRKEAADPLPPEHNSFSSPERDLSTPADRGVSNESLQPFSEETMAVKEEPLDYPEDDIAIYEPSPVIKQEKEDMSTMIQPVYSEPSSSMDNSGISNLNTEWSSNEKSESQSKDDCDFEDESFDSNYLMEGGIDPSQMVSPNHDGNSFSFSTESNLDCASSSGLSNANHKAFACAHCGYSTSRKDRYETHLNLHLVPHYAAKCPHCPFTSMHKTSLSRHLKSHLIDMPFICPHCDYQTSDNSNFKRHLRCKHPDLGC